MENGFVVERKEGIKQENERSELPPLEECEDGKHISNQGKEVEGNLKEKD